MSYGNTNWVYVRKSYTDWIEEAGGIPVIIPFDTDQDKRNSVLSNLQGILFPGGGTTLFGQDGKPTKYQKVATEILNFAKSQNDRGIYYPVIGTCLGFQSIVTSLMGEASDVLLSDFNDKNLPHKVTKTNQYPLSKFWNSLD